MSTNDDSMNTHQRGVAESSASGSNIDPEVADDMQDHHQDLKEMTIVSPKGSVLSDDKKRINGRSLRLRAVTHCLVSSKPTPGGTSVTEEKNRLHKRSVQLQAGRGGNINDDREGSTESGESHTATERDIGSPTSHNGSPRHSVVEWVQAIDSLSDNQRFITEITAPPPPPLVGVEDHAMMVAPVLEAEPVDEGLESERIRGQVADAIAAQITPVKAETVDMNAQRRLKHAWVLCVVTLLIVVGLGAGIGGSLAARSRGSGTTDEPPQTIDPNTTTTTGSGSGSAGAIGGEEDPEPCCPPGFVGLRAFSDCTQYYRCVCGSITDAPVSCVPGQLFDEKLQWCDWDYRVTECSPHSCQSYNATLADSSSPPSLAPTATAIAEIDPPCCPSNFSGLRAHHSDCSGYYSCANGGNVIGDVIQCGCGLIFDEGNQWCDFADRVNCTAPSDNLCVV